MGGRFDDFNHDRKRKRKRKLRFLTEKNDKDMTCEDDVAAPDVLLRCFQNEVQLFIKNDSHLMQYQHVIDRNKKELVYISMVSFS